MRVGAEHSEGMPSILKCGDGTSRPGRLSEAPNQKGRGGGVLDGFIIEARLRRGRGGGI